MPRKSQPRGILSHSAHKPLNPLRRFVRRKLLSLCKHVSLEDNNRHKGQRRNDELPRSQRETGNKNKADAEQ